MNGMFVFWMKSATKNVVLHKWMKRVNEKTLNVYTKVCQNYYFEIIERRGILGIAACH